MDGRAAWAIAATFWPDLPRPEAANVPETVDARARAAREAIQNNRSER